ncbi:MAG: phosphoribosylformylglycinamidine synthase [Candidatus Cloacimonetes bacterium]|nr:phosphoribosylformylglycinamidine synthase [Candidatus Cloacimonadota bacterium]MCF7812882.1 phosphoribosylformylglycinamidine synthase [Candidatus Cloacimonadota bacterium]MCF7867094.1 phosphoribosylformylglycinamidine synthase [Candidatus Cloacimonadota bacterium]MCF7882586.1 phosphoribosylformylglycinamidine synthase [Candidatus Cloacimonadota bacterium]
MKNQIQLVLKERIRDVQGEQVQNAAKAFLNIDTGKVKTGKIFNVMHDLPKQDIEKFANLGLKDEIIHDVYINSFYQNDRFKTFVLAAKMPGVTDDEGVSAQKTLNDILDINLDVNTQHIYTEDIYLFENDLNNTELKELAEKQLGNKLIHHFEFGKFTGRIDYVPEVKIASDEQVKIIDLNVSDEELMKLSKDMLLSLNLEEMKAIQAHFTDGKVKTYRKEKELPENPTDCELEVLAQTWSEHCKHKEFAATIDYENKVTGEKLKIDSLFKTYIRRSTEIVRERLEKSGNNWLLKIFTDNAGVVKIDDENVFVWKVETHNSPSAIDPYGGAITGILGNNRDPLGTGIGGGKLLFNTNVLCFGSPYYDKELLPGQLHPRRIMEGVRHGIEDGGNKSGIPTVNGSIIFDDRYSGKPLVYCGTGGVMPYKLNGMNSWLKPIAAGDLIIMAGGRVGKDGIHGATFSSAEIDEHSPQSAVQIGSPITQKLVSDFMQEAVQQGLIKCSTDNGAGGLSSSVGELATISGGAVVNLEKVPLKYANLKPWEIFISESQERMTFVVTDDNKEELFALAKEREVELSEIGNFTDDGFIDVRFDGKSVAYLDMDFLHDGVPRKYMEAVWEKPDLHEPQLPKNLDYNEILERLMGSLNICSRENVIRQYDHEVKGKTTIKPLMGPAGKAPQDAAVMRINFDNFTGIAVSNGILPRYSDIDAYQMSAGAFDEAIRQIIAVGGKLPDPEDKTNRFWTVNDNFCVPDSAYDPVTNPDGKLKLAKLVQMNQALFDMSTFYNIPMTSGKDSMKNDFKAGDIKISVPPTILYSMVAKVDDVRQTVTSDFKAEGDLIYQIGTTYNEIGASEFYRLFDELGENVPIVRKDDAKRIYEKVMQANEQNLIESNHDISDGGLAVALTESAFGGGFGAEINLDIFSELDLNAILFSESHSRFICSIKPENKNKFEELFENEATLLGKVTSEEKMIMKYRNKEVIYIEMNKLRTAWERGLM